MKAVVALLFACVAATANAQSIVDVAKADVLQNNLKALPECAVASAVGAKTAIYRAGGLSQAEIDKRVDAKIPGVEDRLIAHRVVKRIYDLPELQLQHANELDFALIGMDVCKLHKETGV